MNKKILEQQEAAQELKKALVSKMAKVMQPSFENYKLYIDFNADYTSVTLKAHSEANNGHVTTEFIILSFKYDFGKEEKFFFSARKSKMAYDENGLMSGFAADNVSIEYGFITNIKNQMTGFVKAEVLGEEEAPVVNSPVQPAPETIE